MVADAVDLGAKVQLHHLSALQYEKYMTPEQYDELLAASRRSNKFIVLNDEEQEPDTIRVCHEPSLKQYVIPYDFVMM